MKGVFGKTNSRVPETFVNDCRFRADSYRAFNGIRIPSD